MKQHDIETARRPQTSPSNTRHDEERALQPIDDMFSYLREYARENPEIAALTCLAVGFVLGWKLKPW